MKHMIFLILTLSRVAYASENNFIRIRSPHSPTSFMQRETKRQQLDALVGPHDSFWYEHSLRHTTHYEMDNCSFIIRLFLDTSSSQSILLLNAVVKPSTNTSPVSDLRHCYVIEPIELQCDDFPDSLKPALYARILDALKKQDHGIDTFIARKKHARLLENFDCKSTKLVVGENQNFLLFSVDRAKKLPQLIKNGIITPCE